MTRPQSVLERMQHGSLIDTLGTEGLTPMGSRADTVYEWLKKAIQDERLPRGARVREETIAQELKMSRTPVREALRRLEAEGALETVSGRGLTVSSLADADIAEVFVVRETLEGLAAKLAARAITSAELLYLQRLLVDMENVVREEDAEKAELLNEQFHRVIWQASRNRYLARRLQELREIVFRQGGTLSYPERARDAAREHIAIVDAIRTGDAARAEELGRDHIARGQAFRAWLRERKAVAAHGGSISESRFNGTPS